MHKKTVLGGSKYLIIAIITFISHIFLITAIAPLRQTTSLVHALVLVQHRRRMETPHRIATTKAWTIRLVSCPVNFKNIDFSFRLITLETLNTDTLSTKITEKQIENKRQILKSTTKNTVNTFLIFKKLCYKIYLTYMEFNVLMLNMRISGSHTQTLCTL